MREEAWEKMDEDKKGRVNKLLFFSHQPSAIVSLWEKRRVLIEMFFFKIRFKCYQLWGKAIIAHEGYPHDNQHLTLSCPFQTLTIGDQRSSSRSGNYFFTCCFLLSAKTLDKNKEKQSITPARPWGQAVGVLTQLI